MKKHTKHTNLTRRNNDTFAPNEIAILGTTCDVIANLVQQISAKLPEFQLAYFDASHKKDVQENNLSSFVFHHQGNLNIESSGTINKFNQRLQFSQFDYVFINGNHYQGAKQILILDPAKEASVLKRLAQLDDIQFVVKLTNDVAFFSFLEDRYPQIKTLACYTISEIDKIVKHVGLLVTEKVAFVKGLVLTGGKSTRMGKDKSDLIYFNKSQKEHIKDLLESHHLKTFYSVEKATKHSNEIHDTFLNLGPFGGICSAFQKDPNSALLVLATDLPFVNTELIALLLKSRNPSKVATAIKGKGKEFPEPLITIYEPKAYSILLQHLAQGYSCPRKVLINSDIEIVEVDDALIRNINTPEEFEAARKELNTLSFPGETTK